MPLAENAVRALRDHHQLSFPTGDQLRSRHYREENDLTKKRIASCRGRNLTPQSLPHERERKNDQQMQRRRFTPSLNITSILSGGRSSSTAPVPNTGWSTREFTAKVPFML